MTDRKPIETMAAELRKQADDIEAAAAAAALQLRWAADELERLKKLSGVGT